MDPDAIDRLCECAICLGTLQDAHICPRCSNPFCLGCITEWLTRKPGQCPVCRKCLNAMMLVKARFFQRAQDAIKSLVVECAVHRKKPVSLFCQPCMECICVTCMFAETHVGHRVVLLESAAKDLKIRIKNEMGWFKEREREIANAIGLHGENVKKLTAEKDRIFNNATESLNEVQGQFERGRVQQQRLIAMLETDNKSNAELLRISEEFVKTEKILEFLPKITTLFKTGRFNPAATRPNPVEQIQPKFINDLIPELVVFQLAIKDSQKIQADPGFEFTVQMHPVDVPFYKVCLTMEKGLAGEYSVALGYGKPPTPFRFEPLQATPVGRIKPDMTSPTPIRINLQLAKTYAQKCRQYEALFKELEKSTDLRKQLLEKEKCIMQLKRTNALAWMLGGGFLVLGAVVCHVGMAKIQEHKVICSRLVQFIVDQLCYIN